MPNRLKPLLLLAFAQLHLPVSHADNLYSDNLLQPVDLAAEPNGWNLMTKFGAKEGSGELSNDGYRAEIPRLTYQHRYGDEILFRATIPYVYINNSELHKTNVGDPSFFTTLRIGKHSTATIGVTEPAANRPIEPDVVRFMAFYTSRYRLNKLAFSWQIGVEIPDRHAQEGQDDVLSAGLGLSSEQWTMTVIRKQVVDGEWWDMTRPLDNPLNRTNITATWHLLSDRHWLAQTRLLGGIQLADDAQWWLGLQFIPNQP